MNPPPASSAALHIGSDVVQTLHRAAQLVYPEEACGILLGNWGRGGEVIVRQAVVVPNRAADDRGKRYTIDPRLLLEWERIAQKSGMTTVGFFHSHPDHEPAPSATDDALAWPAYVYVIVGVAAARDGNGVASPARRPLVTGMAAWTFDEASARFNEVSVKVDIAEDQIEYFI